MGGSTDTRVPNATYRLQFHAGFTFRDAESLVPYLDALGVSDIYASPYVKARSGSLHGYDVANPNTLNPEIGTEDDYRALVDALKARGMSQMLDVVPNHMGIGDANNAWWLDVLENGAASIYAGFFDIDWRPLKSDVSQREQVLLPILGDQYGEVLENGELYLEYGQGAFWLRYYDFRLPICPDSYPRILERCLGALQAAEPESSASRELESILAALTTLPCRQERDPTRTEERSRQKEQIKARIEALYSADPAFQKAIAAILKAFNGMKGDSRSYDALDTLLNEQAYRLAFWRVAAEEINYRRFFDINDLAAVRVEDARVFQASHQLLMVLVGIGAVSALRIDHPDGLRDPAEYFWRLQRSCYAALREDASAAAEFDEERERDPQSPDLRPMYVVVEKILSRGERLRPEWPIHGTTGYDFMNQLNGLFVQQSNAPAFDAIYSRFTGSRVRYRDLSNSTRKTVMLVSLPGDVNTLAYQLKLIASQDRRHRDFTLNALTFVVREILASLPVYRTYIDPETGDYTDADRAVIETAVSEAKRRNQRTDPSIFDFVRETLLLTRRAELSPEALADHLKFISKFQQTSSPVMAKGAEDTAFYIYNRLISLNEVGGDPDQFGASLASFHRENTLRRQDWPCSLLSTSTHDSKRSEDVRTRIDVLSEMPREWRAGLSRWARMNSRKRTLVEGRPAPDRNEEYLLYQTLLGAWPLDGRIDEAFRDRLTAFMLKAIKEAKVNTSWINPNTPWEQATERFVHSILDRSVSSQFLNDFQTMAGHVSRIGAFNSLTQTLLKLTCPGVPDIYQGCDLWDFSLVDPDNRRPVDYDLRRDLIADLERREQAGADLAELASELMQSWHDGRIKLHLTRQALHTRRRHPCLFTSGDYAPVEVAGERKDHVCAFTRGDADTTALVVAPVLIATLVGSPARPPIGGDVWRDTCLRLPRAASWRDVFTGRKLHGKQVNGGVELPLASALADFPVALLLAESAGQ